MPHELNHGVRFWLSAPALVSEREPHCSFERAAMFSARLRLVLQPRGWIEIPWQEMTLAPSLSLGDGMHHSQNLGREFMRLMLHHLCAAYVAESELGEAASQLQQPPDPSPTDVVGP